MKHIVRRIATSRALWVASALLAVYALVGFFLLPYLVQRSVPGYAEEHLGAPATIGKVRVNPFLLRLEADDFQLGAPPERPPAAFKHLVIDLDFVSLLHWAWTLADIQVDELVVNAEIARDGRFNLGELAKRWSQGRPSQPDDKPPRTIVRHFGLRAATLTFADFSQPQAASVKFGPIDLEVQDVATVTDREGRYMFTAGLPDGGALSWQGDLTLQPIASKGEWRIKALKLATVWQFFRDEIALAEPAGRLSLTGRYEFSYGNGDTALAVHGVHAQVNGLSLRHQAEQRPMLAANTIEAVDARYDLAKHELVVPRVRLAKGAFYAGMSADGTLNWQRLVRREPRRDSERKEAASPFHARVEAVSIDNVAVQFADHARAAPLEYDAVMHADMRLDIASGAQTRVRGENVRVTLGDTAVKAAGTDGPLVSVKSMALANGQFDTGERTVTVGTLTVKDGATALLRAADGRIALVDAFAPARASNEPAPREKAAEATGWKYAVQAADASGLRVAFADASYKPALRYDLEVSSLALKNIATDSKSPIALHAAVRVAQGGTIDGSGTLAQDFKQVNLKVNAAGINAEPLRSVLAQYTTLDLRTGNASAAARIGYRSGGKPAWRVEGNARIVNVLVNEADTGDRFVSWKMLTAESIALALSPNRMLIKEVRVQEPGGKIVIAKDRSVNLTQVVKRRGGPEATAQPNAESDRFPVRVARLALQQGTLDFADNSLVLPFATRVRSLNGAIVGLSSAPRSRAELKLEGLIEPNGSGSAEGSLRTADPKSFLDINVKFDNVEMPPLSPYTATFAGRKIAAGRLWLNLEYKIVDSQLLGENKIVMADFQLGERVQAPNALDLPLDLAVALLKEPDGRINLAVPVRGDVDNPKFDYGALIRDAISNTLMRIVSAPFRFLAGLLGGKGGEELQSVEFRPGSARLMPPERERLQKVAEALKSRGQLKLVVHGAYGPQRDGRAVRDELVRAALAREMGVKLRPGEDVGPVGFGDPDTQRALEKLFAARAGDGAVQKFAGEYAKKTGKEPRRVNPLLAVFHRGRGDREFYEALFNRLVEIEPLSDAALADLAAQRARAIIDFLAQAGVDPGRIQAGKTQTVDDGSKPVAARLALEAA